MGDRVEEEEGLVPSILARFTSNECVTEKPEGSLLLATFSWRQWDGGGGIATEPLARERKVRDAERPFVHVVMSFASFAAFASEVFSFMILLIMVGTISRDFCGARREQGNDESGSHKKLVKAHACSRSRIHFLSEVVSLLSCEPSVVLFYPSVPSDPALHRHPLLVCACTTK